MKVLVTGGCGFLGSHVCEHYTKKNWEVVAYDNLTKFEYSRVPYFNIEKVRDYNLKFLEGIGVTVIIGDIRDKKVLEKFSNNCDYIVHCAAQPAMTIGIENPQLDFEVNVQGLLNILEVARENQIPMVNCSTIHIYGNGINTRLKEDRTRFRPVYYPGSDLWDEKEDISEDYPILTGTLTPLHASKRAAEIYVQTYIDTYGLRAANFRLTGIYGPRQFGGEDHGWVANFAIRTILELPIRIFGTNKQVRDILYVKDAAKAFDAWHEGGCPPGTYNIGGGVDCITSLGDCLRTLREEIDIPQEINMEPARQGDLYYFCCNTEKAEREFRWSSKILPYSGISNLVHWINENKELFRK